MRRILLVALALSTVVLTPSAAEASTTFGDNLQTDPGSSSFNCDTVPCTDFLSSLSSAHYAAGGFTSPMNGVVVAFTIRVGTATSPVTFRLVRPTDASGDYTGGGTGPTATPPAHATTSYAAHLPVQVGDRVGIDCCVGGGDSFFYSVGVGNGSHSYWNTLTPPATLVDGAPGRAPLGTNAGVALALQATVEPDADHDGFGDETQDQCPTDASTQGPCPKPASTPAPTGQRAAALAQCKKRARKSNWSQKRLKGCKKRASLLPV
jgi:hypothetical protein